MNIRISTLALALAVGASFATDPRLEQGNAYAAQGEYDKAIAEYRAVLAEQPRNSEAYFAAGEARMKKKDYSGAIANYRLAYKYEPTMSAAYEGAAKVYEALGQKAKADAERAKDPKNKPAEEVAQEAAPAMMPIEAGTTAPTETTAAPAETVAAPAAPAPAPAAEAAPAETVAAPAETAAAFTENASPAETVPVAETAPVPVETAAVPTETAAPAAPAETASAPVAVAEPAPVAEPVPAVAEPAQEAAPVASAATLPEDPFERGKVLLTEGKFKEAAPLWREVLAKHPGHAGAYFYAGVTRYELGEMDKAEFNLKKGLSYKEEGNDANFYLACVYQKTKKEEQEKKSLAAYLKKAAPDAKFRKQAEERFAELTKPQATAEMAPAETAQATAEVAPATAAAPEATAAPAESATATTAAVSPTSGPTDIPSVANANSLFKSGDLEGALQMYRALLEKEISPDERYFSMLQMGNIYREMRDFHSAVTRYREVVQQFPDSDWAMEAERAMEDAVWLEKHANELPRRSR